MLASGELKLGIQSSGDVKNWNRKGIVALALVAAGAAFGISLLYRVYSPPIVAGDGLTYDELMTTNGSARDGIMHVETRGSATRIDMGGQAAVLYPGDGRTIMFMPAYHGYMTFQKSPTTAPTSSLFDGIKITATDSGKSQTVNGHTCEAYVMGGDSPSDPNSANKTTLWVCKDFPDPDKINDEIVKSSMSMAVGETFDFSSLLPKGAGVPLRIEMVAPFYNMTIDYTNVKVGSIPDTDLQIPASYRDLDAPTTTGATISPSTSQAQ